MARTAHLTRMRWYRHPLLRMLVPWIITGLDCFRSIEKVSDNWFLQMGYSNRQGYFLNHAFFSCGHPVVEETCMNDIVSFMGCFLWHVVKHQQSSTRLVPPLAELPTAARVRQFSHWLFVIFIDGRQSFPAGPLHVTRRTRASC